MRICVDAGHDGVRDCGAVGQRGCLESDITLYAALALKENLHCLLYTSPSPRDS